VIIYGFRSLRNYIRIWINCHLGAPCFTYSTCAEITSIWHALTLSRRIKSPKVFSRLEEGSIDTVSNPIL